MGQERACRRVLLARNPGQGVELVEPQLITDPELRPAPHIVRFLEGRIAGVTEYLRMRVRSEASP